QNRPRTLRDVPARTDESDAFSKDLKRRGFGFVGSTIVYAHMQAVGMVNDHVVGCFRQRRVASLGRGDPAAGRRRRDEAGLAPGRSGAPARSRPAMRRGLLCLLALLPAVAPAVEPADVTVAATARAVRVQTGAARATIRRGRFRLRVRDATNRTLLTSEV